MAWKIESNILPILLILSRQDQKVKTQSFILWRMKPMRVNNSGICGYSDRGGGIYVYTTYYNMHLCTARTAMEGQLRHPNSRLYNYTCHGNA